MVFSLLPLIIPIFYVLMNYMTVNDKDIVNLDVSIAILNVGTVIVLYTGYPLALPFKPLFTAMGLWEQSSFIAPTIPTQGGYVVLSVIYSALIYIVWSLVSLWRGKRSKTA